MANDVATNGSRLPPSLSIKGELHSEGDILIEGHVEGTLESQAAVVIAAGAVVNAELQCATLKLRGELTGKAQVVDYAAIEAGGRLEGVLIAPRLQLAEGGKVKGYVDTRGPTEEVVDAILDQINSDSFSPQVTGTPKWGDAARHFR